MACKITVMENGIHVSDSCLSPPSLGWLCPTKMSSSQDFDAPQEPLYANMTKALDDRQRERVKERSHDRDSMSEFEFAMATLKNENMHGEHMLAADELFFKGKLLPLYNPDYTDGSEQQVSRSDMRDRVNQQMMLNNTTSTCALYTSDAESSQANTRDMIIPTSPKVAKCSLMLKEFFGLKKMAKSICACTSSGEVAAGSLCKSSRSGSSKKGIKATKTKQKASLMLQANAPSALCKARPLCCASRDANCIIPNARHSVSEPLLACCVGHHHRHYTHLEKANAALSPACVDACNIASIQRSNRVSDSLCTHKASHEQRLLGTSCSENLSNEENTCSRLTGELSRGSRRPSLQMGLGEMSLDKSSYGTLNYEEKACWGCRSNMSPPMGARLGETSPGRSSCSASLSYEEDTHRRSNGEQVRASMRMHSGQLDPERILHRSSSYEGSTCRGLAGEQTKGSRRPPVQVASSPERFPCRSLRYGDNTSKGLTTEQSRGDNTTRGVTTEQSRGATMLPMRIHIGETSPERSSRSAVSQARYAIETAVKSTEISRTKILERSSSYSPKSLQRKYEQLKAIRQREGWRILERSSSYNSGMHSMRVAPVLNVPIIVCMSRSKSSNHGMHTRRKA